jgi:1,4-alpha-glucan branching enzyme
MVTLQRGSQAEFHFFRPQARHVFLVGDFNGWSRTLTPMKRSPSGEWTYATRLPRGVYQFKYLADGEWFLDYAAFGLEQGPFGWNSVLVVEPAPLPSRHAKPSAA